MPRVWLTGMIHTPTRGKVVAGGGVRIVPAGAGWSGTFGYPAVVRRCLRESQRAGKSVSASMTMPSASMSLSFSRTGKLSKSRSTLPWGFISSICWTPRWPQRCLRTCSSSVPSTRRIFFPAILSHFDSVTGCDSKLVLAEQRRDDRVSFLRQPYEQAFILVFGGGFLESFHGVPTVGGSKHLHVEEFGEAEDASPDVRLHGVVQPVFKLVNEQKAIFGVDEGQHDAKEAIEPVAKGTQRYRPWKS